VNRVQTIQKKSHFFSKCVFERYEENKAGCIVAIKKRKFAGPKGRKIWKKGNLPIPSSQLVQHPQL